ncbi:conserved unknown protein [Ectocarpus siliculosus]|uniref:Mediator of RNA polymerase II transcription subunit 4 n=1 Tax=Ectocarpus siliculosus TaxID=2880 RepID=D8LFT3_ECTSI|nr:conserved unknown protein [Ectocarpus siliculosus]|eukprot:CBN75657.1 conserved unknown protein [Ectocarpus siliculosus]
MAEVSRVLSLLREETSIADEVLGALARCQSGTKLDANARAAIRKALVLLNGKEAKLTKASEALREHQQLHAEVESLRQEVRYGEQQVQDCARKLTEADAALRGPLRDAKRLLEAGRKAEAAEIDVRDIVDYAQRISGITSAPAYWKPGMAMVGFAPPAPRPEMMRAGALSAFAVSPGTSSLSLPELLTLARDLDRPPDQTGAAGAAGGPAGGSGAAGSDSTSSSNSSSPSGDGRNRKDEPGSTGGGEGSPKRRGVKRPAGAGEDSGGSPDGGGGGGGGGGGSSGKGKSSKASASASGGSFARPTPPKRPKISLDLDDLDSDDDDDSGSSGDEE